MSTKCKNNIQSFERSWHHIYFLTHWVTLAIIWIWLERRALKMHILWCRTGICSCKLSAKICLILNNPFPDPSLCKLNHISVCFNQISTKIICKQLIPFMFFWSDPWCFGPLSKFQHKTEISIKMDRVSRLSIFCDYGLCKFSTLQSFLGKLGLKN